MLFKTYDLNGLALQNRVVMAPMTRSRATQDHTPTDIMATYYGQRSGAGLIITEGTSPSPNGVGYPRIPGLYSPAQVDAWKKVTDAAHEGGAKIFLQIMHTGRVSHPLNMPDGAQVLSSSAVPAATTEMYTDQKGPQSLPIPKAMNQEEIDHAIAEHVKTAENAIEAGFDGVELHGANGYLIEQFINPHCNFRADKYGGSAMNRCRFAVEVAQAVVNAIGKDKVVIRLSPHGAFNDVSPFDGEEETYTHLAAECHKIGLSYIHLVDHSSMGTPGVPSSLTSAIKEFFSGTIILSGGYDLEKAEKDLAAGLGHLVAFARPYLANPDLVERFKKRADLNTPDYDTFYTPGEKGYTDYPTLYRCSLSRVK